MEDDARERIRKLLVTGDNRMKQGVAAAKARESFEQALAVADPERPVARHARDHALAGIDDSEVVKPSDVDAVADEPA